jgi:hypothetical protein
MKVKLHIKELVLEQHQGAEERGIAPAVERELGQVFSPRAARKNLLRSLEPEVAKALWVALSKSSEHY